MKKIILSSLTLLLTLSYTLAQSNSGLTLFKEDFKDLSNWQPLTFSKIERNSTYELMKESDKNILKASTNNSASGLQFKKEFNVKDFPILKWKWKIKNVFQKGNAKEKSGDDYPIRVYVNFKYDPDKASFGQRLKYKAAKSIYGEYPPHSAMNYIWSNKNYQEKIITSPYSDQSKMIIMNSGDENAGKWFEHEVNILEDYRNAFGEEPPLEASLAIMSDSDNTKESAEAYIEFIEIGK